MLIVADENIPLLDCFFGDIGEIHRVSGRTMSNADVRDADIRAGPFRHEGKP